MDKTVIELAGISKSFPGVKALSEVSLSIRPGEVHAVVGENGAGKSTLIKIMTGFHKMDEGSLKVEGAECSFDNPQQSIDKGIACIYQELSIAPLMDVAKNIFLGNWPVKNGLLDRKKLYGGAREILERIRLEVSPKTMAGDLSIAQQQMVEIGRALTRNAKLIIMDEPTSSLTDREAEVLFELIGRLKDEGVAVVYISHKLDEVLRICDRITVLCDGRNITTVDAAGTTREKLIEYMLGRTLENMYTKTGAKVGDAILSVEGLTSDGVFKDISFEARAGEILGFFGLIGSGRSEIMRAIFGVDKYDGGKILLNGKETPLGTPIRAVKNGLALVPEDRKHEGLALRLSVLENMTLVKLREISRGGFINQGERSRLAGEYTEDLRVKTPSVRQLVGNLSGGNQQKVVIAKWLMMNPQVLILDEPTRGIDVGSKAEIYALIDELAQKGVAVIIISSEMNEILGMSDRIITVFEGRLTAEFDMKNDVTDKEILAAALGGVS